MAARCPFCGGPLHRGHYFRNPRGGPEDLPKEYLLRFSLCCGKEGCRKRVLPRSVLFDGRKVYWRVVILVSILLREQRSYGVTMKQLCKEFGMAEKTVRRWIKDYRLDFLSGRYCKIKGRFVGEIKTGEELDSLFSFFVNENDSTSGVVRLLIFLAENEHLDPGKDKSTQKIGSVQRSN